MEMRPEIVAVVTIGFGLAGPDLRLASETSRAAAGKTGAG